MADFIGATRLGLNLGHSGPRNDISSGPVAELVRGYKAWRARRHNCKALAPPKSSLPVMASGTAGGQGPGACASSLHAFATALAALTYVNWLLAEAREARKDELGCDGPANPHNIATLSVEVKLGRGPGGCDKVGLGNGRTSSLMLTYDMCTCGSLCTTRRLQGGSSVAGPKFCEPKCGPWLQSRWHMPMDNGAALATANRNVQNAAKLEAAPALWSPVARYQAQKHLGWSIAMAPMLARSRRWSAATAAASQATSLRNACGKLCWCGALASLVLWTTRPTRRSDNKKRRRRKRRRHQKLVTLCAGDALLLKAVKMDSVRSCRCREWM